MEKSVAVRCFAVANGAKTPGKDGKGGRASAPICASHLMQTTGWDSYSPTSCRIFKAQQGSECRICTSLGIKIDTKIIHVLPMTMEGLDAPRDSEGLNMGGVNSTQQGREMPPAEEEVQAKIEPEPEKERKKKKKTMGTKNEPKEAKQDEAAALPRPPAPVKKEPEPKKEDIIDEAYKRTFKKVMTCRQQHDLDWDSVILVNQGEKHLNRVIEDIQRMEFNDANGALFEEADEEEETHEDEAF